MTMLQAYDAEAYDNTDGLGWAWLAAVIPQVAGMLSQGQKSEGGGEGAAKSGQMDWMALIKNILPMVKERHPELFPGGRNAAITPGGTAAQGLSPEQVQAIVNATLAARGLTLPTTSVPPVARAMGPVPGGVYGCPTGSLYSRKYQFCFDPVLFASEDDAKQAMVPQAPLVAQQQIVEAAPRVVRRKRIGTGRSARRGRGARSLRGVYASEMTGLGTYAAEMTGYTEVDIDGLGEAMGAATTDSVVKWGGALLLAGTLGSALYLLLRRRSYRPVSTFRSYPYPFGRTHSPRRARPKRRKVYS